MPQHRLTIGLNRSYSGCSIGGGQGECSRAGYIEQFDEEEYRGAELPLKTN